MQGHLELPRHAVVVLTALAGHEADVTGGADLGVEGGGVALACRRTRYCGGFGAAGGAACGRGGPGSAVGGRGRGGSAAARSAGEIVGGSAAGRGGAPGAGAQRAARMASSRRVSDSSVAARLSVRGSPERAGGDDGRAGGAGAGFNRIEPGAAAA